MSKLFSTKMNKFFSTKINFTICFVLLILFLGIVFISFSLRVSLERISYWYILLAWLILIWRFRLNSGLSMKLGLLLFILSATSYLTTLVNISEVLMRLSLIGFLIGILQAFFEYLKNR